MYKKIFRGFLMFLLTFSVIEFMGWLLQPPLFLGFPGIMLNIINGIFLTVIFSAFFVPRGKLEKAKDRIGELGWTCTDQSKTICVLKSKSENDHAIIAGLSLKIQILQRALTKGTACSL